MHTRRYSPRTEKNYWYWIRYFTRFHAMRHLPRTAGGSRSGVFNLAFCGAPGRSLDAESGAERGGFLVRQGPGSGAWGYRSRRPSSTPRATADRVEPWRGHGREQRTPAPEQIGEPGAARRHRDSTLSVADQPGQGLEQGAFPAAVGPEPWRSGNPVRIRRSRITPADTASASRPYSFWSDEWSRPPRAGVTAEGGAHV